MSTTLLLSLGIVFFVNASLHAHGFRADGNFPYSDVDEDETMDEIAARAASYARQLGRNANRYQHRPPVYQQVPDDFGLPVPEYDAFARDILSSGYGNNNNKEADLTLTPKKFAYTPKEAGFYLPVSPKVENEIQKADLGKLLQLKQELENFAPYESPKGEINLLPASGGEEATAESSHESRQPIPDPYISMLMKKNQGEEESSVRNFVPKAPQDTILESPDYIGGIHKEDIHYPNKALHSPHEAVASEHITSFIDSGDNSPPSNFLYIALIAGCSAAVVIAVIAAGICWYRIHERVKAAAEVDYPAYGVTGPSKDVSPSGGDRKLAQSAHMYHYQHQKQQMTAMQKNTMQGERANAGSDIESEDENEDGDYTVYECPGLAGLCNTGEMEVKNPLYDDEPTPASPSAVANTTEGSGSTTK